MKPRARLITAALAKSRSDIEQALLAEQERIVRLHARLRAIGVAEATEAIVTLAIEILETFGAAKRTRALLDYDDLISKTRDLLTVSTMAPWVLYKLDGGIDHILVEIGRAHV